MASRMEDLPVGCSLRSPTCGQLWALVTLQVCGHCSDVSVGHTLSLCGFSLHIPNRPISLCPGWGGRARRPQSAANTSSSPSLPLAL